MRVLIVEDDERLARLIARVLEEERFEVDVAFDGETGLQRLASGTHDVAIVDWMLPKRDGLSLCRAIRAARLPTAILMLTARGQVGDRVTGLDNGADDYLTKPFEFEELLARVRALGRRFTIAVDGPPELRCGNLILDLRARIARHGDQTLDLTVTEWNLLEFLMRHEGQVLTRQQLLEHVWPCQREATLNLVDVYVGYLRRKLNPSGPSGRADRIQTVRGVGYRLVAPERDDVS